MSAQKKRRSTLLLRSLAFNISGSSEQLDMKQCAEFLYSTAVLNFSDPVLVSRIWLDVETGLGSNKDKSAMVGSILTSLGILKYCTDRLDARTLRDLSSAGRHSAVSNLGYRQLFASECSKNEKDSAIVNDWLNHVWSLIYLASNLLFATWYSHFTKSSLHSIIACKNQGPRITTKNYDIFFCLFWYAQQQNPYNL
jgi:hypothetical protein